MQAPRFAAELHRRKVLQTVGIYLVAAWITLQVAGVVGEIWSAPNWALQVLFLVLVAGVPVVAVASWIYDVTREGVVVTDGSNFIGAAWRRGWRGRVRLISWGAISLTGFVILLAYFWPDDYPNDDVRRLMALAHHRTVDPQALEYALYGFQAPAGRSIWRLGDGGAAP
jgi:hypothetical protein